MKYFWNNFIHLNRWFLETAEIYRPYILVQLVSFVIALACATFELHLVVIFHLICLLKFDSFVVLKLNFKFRSFFHPFQLFKHPSFDVVILVSISLMGLLNIFLYCYFGKLATESFEKISNCLYESNWRKLPIKQQKYVLLMMVNAQQPLY